MAVSAANASTQKTTAPQTGEPTIGAVKFHAAVEQAKAQASKQNPSTSQNQGIQNIRQDIKAWNQENQSPFDPKKGSNLKGIQSDLVANLNGASSTHQIQ